MESSPIPTISYDVPLAAKFAANKKSSGLSDHVRSVHGKMQNHILS